MTTRGLEENDFDEVFELLHQGITNASESIEKSGAKTLIDYKKFLSDS